MTKICKDCLIEKPHDQFSKDAKGLQGFASYCKPCKNMRSKKWNEANSERRKENNRKWKEENAEQNKQTNKDWYENNKTRARKSSDDWIRNNYDRYLQIKRDWCKKQYANNLEFKIRKLMRRDLKRCLNSKQKTARTYSLLGYTAKDFLKKFAADIQMFIDNNVEYSIDHCIPLEWFNENTPPSLMSHLDNIQIISLEENLEKKHFYPSICPDSYLKLIEPHIKDEYKFL